MKKLEEKKSDNRTLDEAKTETGRAREQFELRRVNMIHNISVLERAVGDAPKGWTEFVEMCDDVKGDIDGYKYTYNFLKAKNMDRNTEKQIQEVYLAKLEGWKRQKKYFAELYNKFCEEYKTLTGKYGISDK